MRITNHKISRKYGVDQAIGCTTGPSGVFWALRTIPMMLSICRDISELCPDAWLLHYQNPTSTVPLALYTASSIKSIGLCHSVEGTARTLAHYIGAPFEETGHWVAGDRKAVEQAIALDPLTAAVCMLDQIHNMVEELFEANAEYLPQFTS